MQTSEESGRYKHCAPNLGTAAYEQGIAQAAINLKRFHYLRALILGKYTFMANVEPNMLLGEIFPTQGLDFGLYTDFKLEPVSGANLHPREDGSIDPGELNYYREWIEENYRIAEGGILDAVFRDVRSFFSIMLNYHSKAKTTTDPEWDTYFADLKARGFPKKNVDCMFFGRESGCLDGNCPFRHDIKLKQEAREKILDQRRKYMKEPTPREKMADTMRRRNAYIEAHDLDRFEDLPEELESEFLKVRARAFCAYPNCRKPWLLTEEKSPLKACSKCKWAYYCSPKCQKKDWTRHKKEPCAPIEEIIKDDDLWSHIGTHRKGCEIFPIDWSNA